MKAVSRTSFTSAPAVDLANDMIYVGGNGGALHAIELSTMREKWMYIPSLIKTRLINSAPVVAHVAAPRASRKIISLPWTFRPTSRSSILEDRPRFSSLAGCAGEASGYFCLDVTSPYTPSFKWETGCKFRGRARVLVFGTSGVRVPTSG